jgi:hypothetical protein
MQDCQRAESAMNLHMQEMRVASAFMPPQNGRSGKELLSSLCSVHCVQPVRGIACIIFAIASMLPAKLELLLSVRRRQKLQFPRPTIDVSSARGSAVRRRTHPATLVIMFGVNRSSYRRCSKTRTSRQYMAGQDAAQATTRDGERAKSLQRPYILLKDRM